LEQKRLGVEPRLDVFEITFKERLEPPANLFAGLLGRFPDWLPAGDQVYGPVDHHQAIEDRPLLGQVGRPTKASDLCSHETFVLVGTRIRDRYIVNTTEQN